MLRRAFIRLLLLAFGTAGIAAKLGATTTQNPGWPATSRRDPDPRLPGSRERAQGIEKYRPCDGICCHRAPLRPPSLPRWMHEGGCSFCEFHDHTMHFDVNSGCRLMADPKLLQELSTKELVQFAIACLGYPQLYGPYRLGEHGEEICCYRNAK